MMPTIPPQALAGVGVVVTRPRHQAQGLCQQIEQAGGRAIAFPLLEITAPRDHASLQAIQQQMAQFDLILFISLNAVERSQDCLLFPLQTPRAAIGTGTALALQRLGLPATLIPQQEFTSEALLALPEFQPLQYRNILIVRGEGGREYLRQQLLQRGATVTYAEVYRREKPPLAASALLPHLVSGPLVLVLTSADSLAHLAQFLTKEPALAVLWQTPCIVVSPRLVEIALQWGFARPILARGASDAALMEALREWAMTVGKGF